MMNFHYLDMIILVGWKGNDFCSVFISALVLNCTQQGDLVVRKQLSWF